MAYFRWGTSDVKADRVEGQLACDQCIEATERRLIMQWFKLRSQGYSMCRLRTVRLIDLAN